MVEVVVALAISVMLFSGIIVAYTQTCRRAEWSGYSLAAQSLAIQQLEQARAAKWDRSINELASLPLTSWSWDGTNGSGYSVSILDLPLAGTNNVVYATNRITVKMIYVNNATVPPVKVQLVRVDTVWRFMSDKAPKLFTNTVATYLAPDNLSADLL